MTLTGVVLFIWLTRAEHSKSPAQQIKTTMEWSDLLRFAYTSYSGESVQVRVLVGVTNTRLYSPMYTARRLFLSSVCNRRNIT